MRLRIYFFVSSGCGEGAGLSLSLSGTGATVGLLVSGVVSVVMAISFKYTADKMNYGS